MPSRNVTSRDVARKAGVSRTTVSFVLNNVEEANISEETRQRVLEAAQALGYVPHAAAQVLAGQRTRMVGLIIPPDRRHLPSHLFLLPLMEGMLYVVQQHGLRLLIDSPGDDSHTRTYLDLVRAKRLDGLIMFEPRLDDPALQALAEDGFPLVLIGHLPGAEICSVDVDNRAAARMAVDHLLQLGHRRICCITNAPQSSYTATAERLLGYQDALNAAGLPHDPALVQFADYTPDSGFECMNTLLDQLSPPPTAAFVASDVVAFGALSAIQQRGLRVPQDIAVAGFDDVPFARFANPPLTTVRLPIAQQGHKAAELLLDLILMRAEAGRRVLLDTELVVRGSTAAASPPDSAPANIPSLPTDTPESRGGHNG